MAYPEFLARLEEQMLDVAQGQTDLVTEAASHIIAAGGKRFRPAIVFHSAAACGGAPEADVITAAMVMELTHVASLYHDDVMDEALIRRGTESANERWGNTVAILVGDYLFAKASSAVAELGVEYVKLQAETFQRLVQGQIAETVGPAVGVDPYQHYLKVLEDKTGSLIEASARFGGMVAGASDEFCNALGKFGAEVGTVFQISDDIIDIASDETGKTPGTDLREGVATLPVLMLRSSTDPNDLDLAARIDGDLTSDAALSAVLADLRAHPVLDQARAEVRRRADAAIAHLAPLPDSEAKDELIRGCNQLVDRTT